MISSTQGEEFSGITKRIVQTLGVVVMEHAIYSGKGDLSLNFKHSVLISIKNMLKIKSLEIFIS